MDDDDNRSIIGLPLVVPKYHTYRDMNTEIELPAISPHILRQHSSRHFGHILLRQIPFPPFLLPLLPAAKSEKCSLYLLFLTAIAS